LFCGKHDENIKHIFSCTETLKIVKPGVDRLRAMADPYNKLDGQLQWFLPRGKASLAKAWSEAVPEEHQKPTGEASEWNKTLQAVEKHDAFAGMLGVMPPKILLIYEKYFTKFGVDESENKERQTKLARKNAAERVKMIRLQCIDISTKIWKNWTQRQRKFQNERKSERKAATNRTLSPRELQNNEDSD